MLKIKGKVYVRVREKEAKSLTRKEKSSGSSSVFLELKISNISQGQRSSQLRILF